MVLLGYSSESSGPSAALVCRAYGKLRDTNNVRNERLSLLPGSRVQFEDGVAAVEASLGRTATPHPPLWFGASLELGVMGLVLWVLLLTSKAAFVRAERRTPAS
jgi:hypothetical protein